MCIRRFGPEDNRAFATRLARFCARNPVALERLIYDRTAEAVTYRSDKSEGPTAGTEIADPLEFLAPVLIEFGLRTRLGAVIGPALLRLHICGDERQVERHR
jgi:hypothetical protein